jgi:hypothetical protein
MRNYRTLLNTFAHINRFPVPHHFLDMPDYVFSMFVHFEYDFIINKNKINTEFMPIAPGDLPTQCDEGLIQHKEVPFGGGSDNKFHLGSDISL